MKNIKKIITIGMITFLVIMAGITIHNQNKIIEQARAELSKKEILLQEAKQPSEIEKQKAELIKLEKQWKQIEEAIYKLQALKPRIEAKIQNLRKEIITTNPKEIKK